MKRIVVMIMALFLASAFLQGCREDAKESTREHHIFSSTEESLTVGSENIVKFFFAAPAGPISGGDETDYRSYMLSIDLVTEEDGKALDEPYAEVKLSGILMDGNSFSYEGRAGAGVMEDLQTLVKRHELTRYHGIFEYTDDEYGDNGVELSAVYDTGEEIWFWRNDECFVPYETSKAFLSFGLKLVGDRK